MNRRREIPKAAIYWSAAVFRFISRAPDFDHVNISDIHGAIGPRGKRVELTANASNAGLQKVLALEVYDNFPSVAFLTSRVSQYGYQASQAGPNLNSATPFKRNTGGQPRASLSDVVISRVQL